MVRTVTNLGSWRFITAISVMAATLIGVIEVSSSDEEIITAGSQDTRIWPDNLYGVEFVDSKNGWISGYAGTMLRTLDGGNTWELNYIGSNELIRNFDFVDARYGWAVGHRGSIFHTADGGETWQIQHTNAGIYLRDISFTDRTTGWVVGHDATILHTVDGGQSWENQQLTGFKGRDLPRLHAVVAQDRDNAFLVGEFGVMASTSDAGKTWPVLDSKSRKTLLSIASVADHFIATGLDGTIAHISKTADAQYDIKWLKTDTREHFFAVCSAPDATAIAVGRSIVTKIEGETVTPLSNDKSIALPFTWFGGVDALDDGTFWMVGIRGTLARGDLKQSVFRFALNISASDRVTRKDAAGPG